METRTNGNTKNETKKATEIGCIVFARGAGSDRLMGGSS
jgi:hypothetical protein